MQRADAEQEQLWNHIQARKQKEQPAGNGHRNGDSNCAAGFGDALLVNALCATFEEDQAACSDGSEASRSLLKAAIHADLASRTVRRPSAPKFWRAVDKRQLVTAIALCLITAAALAYLLWYSLSSQSCSETVPVIKSAQAPSAAPATLLQPEQKTLKPSALSSAPAIGAKVQLPALKSCK